MQTDRKAKIIMFVIFFSLSLGSLVSFINNGFATATLILMLFALLALFIAISTPKQVQDLLDTLSD